MKTMKFRNLMLVVAGGALLASLGCGGAPATHKAPEIAGPRPMLRDSKGKEKPFPDSPYKVSDEQWRSLAYPLRAGFKPRIAVIPSKEMEGLAQRQPGGTLETLVNLFADRWGVQDPRAFFDQAETIVRQSLGATNYFTIVERSGDVDELAREERARSGMKANDAGADYLIKVAIVEANPEKESSEISGFGGAFGGNSLGLGKVGLEGKVAWCRMSVALIKTATSEVVGGGDLIMDGTAKGKKVGGGIFGFSPWKGGGAEAEKEKVAALTDAVQACANKIAWILAAKIEEVSWDGVVASVHGQSFDLLAGTNIGLGNGVELTLLQRGAAVVNPADSTDVRGYKTKRIGRARIVDVQDTFSTCEIIELSAGEQLRPNDIARLEGRRN